MVANTSPPTPEQADELARSLSSLDIGTTPACARRFLEASNFDMDLASTRLRAHKAWREALPDPKGANIKPLLDSRRFRLAQGCKHQAIVVDFMWGRFLDGFSLEDCLAAFGVFLELVSAQEPEKLNIICVGGPPPLTFARDSSAMFAANFPGLLGLVVVFPALSWLSPLVNGVAHMTLPASMRAEFRLCSTEAELSELTGIDPLPAELRQDGAGELRLEADAADDSDKVVQLLLAYAYVNVSLPDLASSECVERVSGRS